MIEYATNTYEKYFYTFRIYQIIFTYSEMKKKRPNFYGIFADFCRFYRNIENNATSMQCTNVLKKAILFQGLKSNFYNK